MNENIKNIEDNFNQVKINRLVASWALLTLTTSNVCVSIFNKTKEGNIFNICRESVYLRCIIETRKILEPNKADKTANLDYIIGQVYNNKDFFIQKHYNDSISIERHWCSSSEEFAYIEEYMEKRKLENAQEAQQRCLEVIELVRHRWCKLWTFLGNSPAFMFLKEKRNLCVHSIMTTNIFMPPINKMQKLLNLILWFIKKLDFIIYNTSSNLEELDKEAEFVAYKFWNYMHK